MSIVMSIAASLLPEFDQEMSNTRKVLERVPEGKSDWKPHEKSMSLGALSSHLANIADWGVHTVEADNLEMGDGDYKPFVPKSTAELVARFDDNAARFRTRLERTTDEAMLKNWTMKWNGQTIISMPRLAVIRGTIMNHSIHHRAQLTVYLRMLGVPVPALYGPSADENPSS